MERDQCFVCGVALASIVNCEINWRSRKTGAALLENNLDVIFLLRKLLQVPGIQLECQLGKCGDNPERWISLCDQCTQLVKKARELDEELQKIERELRSIKKNVLQKISVYSSRATDDKPENGQSYSGNSFVDRIRSSVINPEYTRLNDEAKDLPGPGLVEGDQLAKYLDSQGNHCTAAILLVEKPCEEHQDDIKVEHESPPVSPAAVNSPPDQFVEDDDLDIDTDEDKDENVKGTLSCSVCSKIFSSAGGLRRHVRVVHEKQLPITCPLCPMAFESKMYMQKHLLAKHKDDPVTKKFQEETGFFLRKCSVIGCVRRFIKQADEDRHMKEVHDGKQSNDKRHKCQYCGRGFWDKGKCRRHEKIHEEKGKVRHRTKTWSTARKAVGVLATTTTKINKKPYNFKFKCDTCGKGFRWAKNWSEHLWDKHQKKDITCPGLDCGKIFSDDLVEFQKHWKSCRPRKIVGLAKAEKHLCSICGKEFLKRNALSAHLKSHEKKTKIEEKKKKPDGEKSDKRLSSSSSRKRAEGPFNCGICGKDYISQRSLWQHKRTFHRNGTNNRLVRAKRRRKGERPLSPSPSLCKVLCNICGKEFSCMGNLKTHVKYVHEKEFSLSCHLCGRTFTNTSQMKMHILGSHGEDPVARQLREEEGLSLCKCPLVGCAATFLKKEALDKHVEKYHQSGSGGGGGGGDKEEMDKRFKCKYCGKGFWVGYKMRRHERIHEGKGREDFKCGICGKGFGTPDYLNYHRLLTHKQAKKFQKNNA